MIGDPVIRFMVPAFSEVDTYCPVVFEYKIYDKTCTTLSTDFQNSDITIHLSNGFLSAYPIDKTTV